MAVWEQSKYDSEEQNFLINGMTLDELVESRKKEKENEKKNGKDKDEQYVLKAKTSGQTRNNQRYDRNGVTGKRINVKMHNS